MGGLLDELEAELTDYSDFPLGASAPFLPWGTPQTSQNNGTNNPARPSSRTATDRLPTPVRTPGANDTSTRLDTVSQRLARRRSAQAYLDRFPESRGVPQSAGAPEISYRRNMQVRNLCGILTPAGLTSSQDRFLGRRNQRGVSESVINTLPIGTYGDWAVAGETEDQCPICFDEVSRISHLFQRLAHMIVNSVLNL